jgi:hypothetical protein
MPDESFAKCSKLLHELRGEVKEQSPRHGSDSNAEP